MENRMRSNDPIYPAPDILNELDYGRFVLANLAAKRAKQIRNGGAALVKIESNHPLSIALAEIAQGKIKPLIGVSQSDMTTELPTIDDLDTDDLLGDDLLLPDLGDDDDDDDVDAVSSDDDEEEEDDDDSDDDAEVTLADLGDDADDADDDASPTEVSLDSLDEDELVVDPSKDD